MKMKNILMVSLLSMSMLVNVGCQNTSDDLTTTLDVIECTEMRDIVILDNENVRLTITDKIAIGNDFGYAVRVENKSGHSLPIRIKATKIDEKKSNTCLLFCEINDELFIDEFMCIPAANIEDVDNVKVEGTIDTIDFNNYFKVDFEIN